HGSSTQVPEQAWEALRILVSILPRLPATPDALAHAEGLVARGISADFPAANDQLQRLREIHARPAVLQQLQDTLVPLMVHIFALTVNVSAQYRVLLVVLKAVFCLDAARLQAALDSVDLPPFIAGTVALLEAPILAAVSLLIIRIVHDKTRAQYARRFAREGVVDSLARLALAAEGLLERAACHASGHGTAGSTPWDSSDSSALSDASDKSSEGTNEAECGDGGGGDCGLLSGFALVSGAHIPSSARHGAISASQRPFFTADLPVSVGRNEAVPLLRWILAHARVLRGELDSAALAQGDCDILDQLQLLAARFADPNATRAALGASADALSVHLTSPLGVTCHELVHSGLVASLEGALARDDARDVVDRLLCHCVDGQPRSVSSSALGVLIGRLHEALGSSEALRVHEAYRSGSDETHSPAHMLSKQVRFAVSPAPADAARQAVADSAAARAMEQVRRGFLPIRVSVHAVATFSVLEAYLRPRIALLIRDSQRRLRRRRRHLAAAEGPSDTPDEETQTGGVRPHQAQLERLGSEAPDGSGTGSNSAQRKREQEHLRMLRMIAQASGIDLRAAALFDGLDLDMDLGDDAGGQEADSESDADDATTEDPPDADDARASAAAAAAAQQGDWHLRFVLRVGDAEREADASDNIFRAIHELWQRDPLLMNASPWAHTFELRFCVEFGPRSRTAPAEPLSDHTGTAPDGDDPGSVLGTEAASVVSLLGRLHGLLSSAPGTAGAPPELDRLFVNRKISAKAARQLGDPLMVVCSALPDWCHRLVARAPFLVAFDVRLAYMQATYFGYSRNINHWQVLARREQHGDDRAQAELQIPLGHVQRQKVRISRHRMLESALKVMDLYGTAKTILEVEYFDEVGSGIGPTLEFYSTVSRCLQERGLGLWRDEGRGSALEPECGRSADHVSAPHGLFPAPIGAPAGPHADSLSPDERAVQLFGFMGRLVAKCLIDGRILDIPFSAEFWAAVQRHLSGGPEADEAAAWTWRRLEALDPRLASSLQYLDGFVAAKRAVYAREGQSAAQTQAELDGIRGPDGKTSLEDLALEFTLPGHPSIELRAGGADVPVTISNVDAYISLVVRWTLHTGIRSQIAAFCEGFGRIFSPRSLLLFTPAELCSLAGQAPSDDAHWTRASLLDSIKVDHGFTLSSPEVHMFIDFLVSLDGAGRRQLLQFATGSPRLPLGGFRALHPPLTLVPRPATAPLTPDDYLPTVMTCANYIKLPLYSSPDVLARRWRHAMAEGQNSFHMS
ncbi:Ubiquitin fusion degradation protein 4, partial [Coemansia javaensis]